MQCYSIIDQMDKIIGFPIFIFTKLLSVSLFVVSILIVFSYIFWLIFCGTVKFLQLSLVESYPASVIVRYLKFKRA